METKWGPGRVSSYSEGTDNCVEVAFSLSSDAVSIVDTKDPERTRLILSQQSWRRFLATASRDGFRRQ